MNKLFSATFTYTLSIGLTRFVSFLLLPLYTNILSPADFGNYGLLMAIYVILNVLYQAGLLQGLTGFFFSNGYPRDKVVRTTYILLFSLCVSFALIITLIAQPLSHLLLSNTDLSGLLILLAWILVIDNLSFLGLQVLKNEQKAGLVAIFSAISAVINIIFNIIFMISLNYGITGIFLAQALSGFVLFSLCLPKIINYFKVPTNKKLPNLNPVNTDSFHETYFDKKLASNILLFSLPFVFAGIFGILMDVIDRFFIDIYMTREAVGLYSFAYKIGSIMGIFIIAFRTAYLPYILNNKNKHNFSIILRDIFTKLLALMSIIFIIIVLFAQDISMIRIAGNFIINPEYSESMYIVPLIVIGYIFNGLASFFSIAPYITKKTHHFIISDSLGLTANIILNIIIIPIYGLIGAAISTVVAFLVSASYLYVIFCSNIKIPFSFWKIMIILVTSLLAIIGGYFTNSIYLKLLILFLFVLVCWKMININFNKTDNIYRE